MVSNIPFSDELINTSEKKIDSKAKALEELNELDSLLKQSLSGIVSNSRLKSARLVKHIFVLLLDRFYYI